MTGIKLTACLRGFEPRWRLEQPKATEVGAHNAMLKVCHRPQYLQASSPGWPDTYNKLIIGGHSTLAPLESGLFTAFKRRQTVIYQKQAPDAGVHARILPPKSH